MKISRYAIYLFLLTAPFTTNASLFDSDCPTPPINASGASYETAFTPDDALADLVVKNISTAKSTIRVAAHKFVSKTVSIALISAERSGKDVQIILDKGKNDDGYSDAIFFINMSHPPHSLKDKGEHEDYIVIDNKDLIFGNFSTLPEIDDEKKNAANVLVIHNVPELAKKYTDNWQKLWDNSEVMKNKNLIQVTTPQKK